MKRLLFLLPFLVLPLMAQTTPADHPTRGYVARACGFDLDHDGVIAGAGDCDICDSTSGTGVVAADYDSDGDDETEIYIDGTSGTDNGTCGGPDDACKTIAYVLANRTGTGSFEDAMCYKGTGTTEPDPINWDVSGDAGTWTRLSSGNEVRDFEYGVNPIMLVGWDADNDGSYPPFDTDDTAVIDGSDTDQCFIIPAQRVEFAHMTISDCGNAANPGGGSAPLGAIWNMQRHIFLHDIELYNINKDQDTGPSVRTLSPNATVFSYLAVENVLCDQCGGFGFRQSFNDAAGPMRWKNYQRVSHGQDDPGGGASHWDYWGQMTGVEIIDSILDGNHGAWNGERFSGIGHNQCAQDFHFVNNSVIDSVISFEHSDSNFCNAGGRPTGGTVTIDGNSFVISADSRPNGYVTINFSDDSGTSTTNRLQGTFTITNNISYPEVGSNAQQESFVGGQIDADPGQGELIVVNNTVLAINCWFHGGVIDLEAGASEWNNITHKNNIYENTAGGSDCDNFNLDWVPSGWDSDYNRFDGNGGSAYVLGTGYSNDLGAYQSASGQDANSVECIPTYIDEAGRDLHLAANDLCALDNGATLLTVTDADFDGPDNRPVNNWDIGADEVEEGEDPPAPDPGDGIVLSGSGLDGSNTQ